MSRAATTPTGSSAAVARFRAVFQGYRGVQVTVRAAALTYISIFSLIPLAVVALVLLRVFGEEAFEMRVERFMLRLLSPGVAEDTMTMLRGILNQASAKVAGLLGFATLFVSAVPLVQNLDGSLNQVWNVKENRPYPIRVLVWLAAIVAAPLVLGVTLSATSLLHRVLVFIGMPFRGELLSVLATIIAVGALTVLYVVTPNCTVHWRFALAGATVAGVLWSVARILYSSFAAQTFRYGMLYGSLGALPLFLLWLYVSWLLVLVGARLAYALQRGRRRSIWPSLVGHPRGKELAGVRVVQHLTRSWLDKAHAPSRAMVAHDVELPEEVVQPVLEALRDAELVHEGKHSGWSPARDPAQLSLAEAIAALRGHDLVPPSGPDPDLPSADLAEVDSLLASVDADASSRLKHVSWVELADLPSRAAPPKS